MEGFENSATPPSEESPFIEEPSPVDPPQDERRKAFKASIHPAGRTLLLFLIVQQLGAGIFIGILGAIALLQDPQAASIMLAPDEISSIRQAAEPIIGRLSSAAWILTAFTLLAYLTVALPSRKIGGLKEDLRVHKRMPFGTFVKLTCVATGAQLLYMVLMPLLSRLMPSINNGMEVLDELLANPSSLIFASLVGPVVEELLFRGALISALKRHGKWYAILVSSILFGLFHANVPQAVFAFSIGLVLGYVAIEYSVWWSIVLHVFNNFVLAQLPTLLAGKERALLASGISGSLTLALGVAGLVFAIRKRKRIAQFVRDNPIRRHYLCWTFTQWCYLALTVFCGGIALMLLRGAA